MSENKHDSQEKSAAKFDRGTALSVFHKDRNEDYTALIFALLIALGVYLTVA